MKRPVFPSTAPALVVAVVLTALLIAASGMTAYLHLRTQENVNAQMVRTDELVSLLDQLEASMVDAESAQRGYQLSSDPAFLGDFQGLLDQTRNERLQQIQERVLRAQELSAHNPQQHLRMTDVRDLVRDKLQVMEQIVHLHRDGFTDEALRIVREGYGKRPMDGIRAILEDMRAEERAQLDLLRAERDRAIARSLPSAALVTALALLTLAILVYLTRRAALEQARSEQRFRSLVEATSDVVWTVDNAMGMRDGNQSWQRFTGQGPAEYLGGGWAEAVHPQDLPHLLQVWEEARADGSDWHTHARLRRHDGQYRETSMRGVPVRDADANVVEWVGTCTDVTELAKAERDFRTLADNISQLAWMADESGSIFWYNRRWFEYTGTTPDEMHGWGWTKVHHPEHLDRVVERISACFRSGIPWEDTFPLRGADGRYRWFLSRALPIHDPQGKLVRWFGTNTDITGQRELEQELTQANRQKDEFIATLAHELRNPLAPVSAGLDILKLIPPDSAQAARTREVMERQVNHLVRLIDDLLDISRISRGKVALKTERLDARAVVNMALDASRPQLDAAGHRVEVRLPEQEVMIEGDLMRLSQVVANLIDNAAKYTPDGGQVVLELRAIDRHVEIRVEDNGIGIPADKLARVFDMFMQVERSGERVQGGLGIGLSLVKQLVELHEGAVTAHSDGPGKGSRFSVILPLVSGREAPGESDRALLPRTGSERAARRVLVLDDNEDAARTLALILELCGHQTCVVHNGPEALEKARTFRPDLAFLDIGLPGMDGHEVARRLRAMPETGKTRLIALTGWGGAEDVRRSREAGCERHLVKPATIADVRTVLEDLR